MTKIILENFEPCSGDKHVVYDSKIIVPNVELFTCYCGYRSISKRKWYRPEETDKLFRTLKKKIMKLNFKYVSEKQIDALLKRALDIPLNSTERTHIKRFYDRKNKIAEMKREYNTF